MTRGDLLEADGTTVNVGRAITSGPGRNFGAVALESGTVGQLISVQVIIPAGSGSPSVSTTDILTATTKTVAISENGKTFYLSAAANAIITVTLPTAQLGLKYRFIVKTVSSGTYVITATPSDTFFGMMEERAGTAGVAGAATDIITFTSSMVVGDWVDVESDGTNWYFHGMVDVAVGVTTTG